MTSHPSILKGPLSEQQELIQQAKRRAHEVREATPVKEYVDADHWIFKIPGKRPPGRGGQER